MARRLAKDGFSVVVNHTGNAAEAESVVGDIKQGGGNASSIQADVSDPAAMRRMFDQAAAVSGGVDVLVNNAGIMRLANIGDADDALFDRHVYFAAKAYADYANKIMKAFAARSFRLTPMPLRSET